MYILYKQIGHEYQNIYIAHIKKRKKMWNYLEPLYIITRELKAFVALEPFKPRGPYLVGGRKSLFR